MNDRLVDLLHWLRESLKRDEEMSKTLQSFNPTVKKPNERVVDLPQNKSFEELMRALATCMESSIEAIDRVSSIANGEEPNDDGNKSSGDVI